MLLRLWAGFMATALRRHAAGAGGRPLLVVLDCKGGGDSRRVADRARRVLRDAGARATAVWPDEASLSIWDLPPGRLVTTLLDLIEHGSGPAAYGTGRHESELALIGSAARQVPDVALRFRALFRRLGPGLDGPGSFADADVWYCILEGTAEIAVAEAQARTLVDLLASYVAHGAGRPVRTPSGWGGCTSLCRRCG